MTDPAPTRPGHPLEVLAAFLKLGLTSFGGPVAHLGFFRTEFVQRRGWLDDARYADLVALCQFLPGPASSQVGMALGLQRAGWLGALMAWIGFTLPSALALVVFALGVAGHPGLAASGAVQGLKVVAVAVVAQAVWALARALCPDLPRAALAIAAAVLALTLPTALAQVGAIAACGLLGWRLLAPTAAAGGTAGAPVGPRAGAVALALFVLLLAGLPLMALLQPGGPWGLLDAFYRAGALVFGGGHVVLPLLQASLVPAGWVDTPGFLAGYGAAQAVPGPLFSVAAYLGAIVPAQAGVWPGGWAGGLLALVLIFLPGFLLVVGVLPFWARWRGRAGVRAAVAGINAGVVGLLLAALVGPVWGGAIHGLVEFGLALAAFGLLAWGRVSPLWVVLMGALAGAALGLA